MTLDEMIEDLRASQQRIVDMLTYKCEQIVDNHAFDDHDSREMFSCILDQTLCVDVIAYAKAEEYVVTLHCYFTKDCVYNLTYLREADFSESVVFKCVDFEDAMCRICDVVRNTHRNAI